MTFSVAHDKTEKEGSEILLRYTGDREMHNQVIVQNQYSTDNSNVFWPGKIFNNYYITSKQLLKVDASLHAVRDRNNLQHNFG